MLFREKNGPSNAPRPIRFDHLKEGMTQAVRLLQKLYPDPQRAKQRLFDRWLSELRRATEPADLEEVAMELTTLEVSGQYHVEDEATTTKALLVGIIEAIVPLALAVNVPGVATGLTQLQAVLASRPPDDGTRRRLETELELLASAVSWLRNSADVFRGSIAELIEILRPLAQTESEAHDRLVLLRRGLDDAADVRELEELRSRLIAEAALLVEEASRRNLATDVIKRRIEEHKTQIKVLESALTDAKTLATTDPLTGLGNRSALDEAAATAAQSTRDNAVLFIDVDRFKAINDQRGHRVGDVVLRELARRICAELRESDGAFRVGGEEFVALLDDANEKGALAIAERIRERVACTPVVVEGTPLQVTVSIGCAQWSGGARFPDTLKLADEAMYRAKRSGRNQVATAS